MLRIDNICKEYKTGALIQKALDGVSLNLRDNEFVAILGPSGSGKTTLLNIIGGLDRYDEGDLIINEISTKKYADRDWDSYRNHTIGFVFQNYNLIPHQTILSNVELALTISGISKEERKQKAREALDQVGLKEQGHKKPNQMSGGQMQRVAIARALVNNPDILLADEPTGALDSDTSIQVMNLLKEVAKDRLVVMVTHNPELAKAYATRIVELKDGRIQYDTNAFELNEKDRITARHETMGKSSMSFLTSLLLSFNNLRTKKARTFLTSFAGSIGIIGIALILSLSNGVDQYIQSIEEETLSEYPLQIQSTAFDMNALLVDAPHGQENQEKDESKIHVSKMITNMFSKIGANDLASLKAYLDAGDSGIQDHVNAIDYAYQVTPQIYSDDANTIRQIHPDTSFSKLGFGSSASANGMMSSMMSTDTFYQMPSSANLYENQYDIMAGNWPKNYNECVLVLTKNGNISDFTLYTLGLRDASELDTMIEQFTKEEEVVTPTNMDSYTFEDVLNKKFKLVNASDYYVFDETYNLYKDKREDMDYMADLITNGEDIKIVGIVKPTEDATATMLKAGIAYPAQLNTHVIEQASASDIVNKQLADTNINVFTGKAFDTREDTALDMNSLFTIDEAMMKQAFSFDQSKLIFDESAIDLSSLTFDATSLPPISFEDIIADLDYTSIQEPLVELGKKVVEQFNIYQTNNNLMDPSKINEYFILFMQTQEAQMLIQNELHTMILESGLSEQFQIRLEEQMKVLVNQYTQTISTTLQEQMNRQLESIMENMKDAFSIDTSKFSKAIKMKMNEQELSELMVSLMTTEVASYEGNLKEFGYADLKKPSSISLYPKDFENKQEVIHILDSYNEQVEKEDKDKVISYVDYIGTLMSSVTDIIDVISYVLIAFVAISLVVSSIMIGVITYISVLERKKEIGILRAIGASKRNISQVFNAETFIIGLLAGLLGVITTLLLLIPGNMLIHTLAGNTIVNASLPFAGGVILIVLSVILTLLGGLIPSKKAAQEDPVTALRND